MKKRGVSYVEILVAVAIFSVGIVPLMMSLGHSFEATVFNRDYTKAMEYNQQLMEEISAMMPTKVPKSSSSSNGYKDLDELAEEVKEMILKRSEKGIAAEGIYSIAQWSGSNFNFESKNIMDPRMYREIKIEAIRGDKDEGELSMDVDIYTYRKSASESVSDPLIVRNYMTIKLLGDGEYEFIGGGGPIDSGIDIPPKEDDDETNEVTTPNKDANFIRLILGDNAGNAGKIDKAWISINENSYVAMEKSTEQSSKQKPVFEKEIDIPASSKLVFKVERGDGDPGRIHKVDMEYYLYYKPQ